MWNPRDILTADSFLDVDWGWLDLLKVLSDVIIIHLPKIVENSKNCRKLSKIVKKMSSLLSLLLPFSSESEEIAAEGSWHRCIGVVLAIVQHMLEHIFVPPREVVTVKHLYLQSHEKTP